MTAPNSKLSIEKIVLLTALLVLVGILAAIFIPYPAFPTLEEVRSSYLEKEGPNARGQLFQQVALYIDHETDNGRVFSNDELVWNLGSPEAVITRDGEIWCYWPYNRDGVKDWSVIARCTPDGKLIKIVYGVTPDGILEPSNGTR